MTTWFENPFRPTRDLDLLGFGDNAPDGLVNVFREICSISLDDGVAFDVTALTIHRIREESEYGGLRLHTTARLAKSRVRTSIDIAFGDATEPGLQELYLPVLLEFPSPYIRAYRMETVVAEKFQAIVMLGRANTRMKDYYDIWILSQTHAFMGGGLADAMAATFARRGTDIPSTRPDGLSEAFAKDVAKIRQWQSFTANIETEPLDLAAVIEDLAAFLMPRAEAARRSRS